MSAPDKAGAIRALPLKLASRKRGRAPVWLQNGTRFRFQVIRFQNARALIAARPLHPHLRDAFLQKVAIELRSGRAEIGPVEVHRVMCKVQSHFFDPPLFGLMGE